jgi:tetratricopeptide (TPR) repeat protein
LVWVIAPNAVHGQGNTQAASATSLPSAAQEALDKGIIAAKVPDYSLAIRFFEEARKLAPTAPVVFMNLGIAESKMPGRELRAIAWFGAYLAALPDAANVTAVKEQIAVLDVRNQSNVSRLIKTVQDLASKVPGRKDANLRDVARLWAEAGDIKTALEAANLASTADWKSTTQTGIAEAQIRAGDIAGAQETLALAQKSTDLIESRSDKSSNRRQIAEAQMKAGDIAGARNTLAAALKDCRSRQGGEP